MPHTSAYEDAQALRRQMEEQLSRWMAAHDTDTVVRARPECVQPQANVCAAPARRRAEAAAGRQSRAGPEQL